MGVCCSGAANGVGPELIVEDPTLSEASLKRGQGDCSGDLLIVAAIPILGDGKGDSALTDSCPTTNTATPTDRATSARSAVGAADSTKDVDDTVPTSQGRNRVESTSSMIAEHPSVKWGASVKVAAELPWVIEPTGVAIAGGPVAPWTPQDAAKLKVDTPSKSGLIDFVSRSDASEHWVHEDELRLLVELKENPSDDWALVKTWKDAAMYRHADKSLFGGALVGKFTVSFAGFSKELLTHCLLDTRERCKWDANMRSMSYAPGERGLELQHYYLEAPPFMKRDFVTYHAICRHVDGSGLMIYVRSAPDFLLPAMSSAIRGEIFLNCMFLTDTAEGCELFVLTALDLKMPLPFWVINIFVPRAFHDWVTAYKRHATELLRKGLDVTTLPSNKLYERLPRPTAETNVDAGSQGG